MNGTYVAVNSTFLLLLIGWSLFMPITALFVGWWLRGAEAE